MRDTSISSGDILTSDVATSELATTSEPSRSSNGKEPLEIIAKRLGLKASDVLCAKMLRTWPIGFEVTEAELLKAVEAAKNVQIS